MLKYETVVVVVNATLYTLPALLHQHHPNMTTTDQVWQDAGYNKVCDTSKGEVYIKGSPGRLRSGNANFDKCKRTCEDSVECQSITLYKSGWCSHFSTLCKATKWSGKATSARLVTTDTIVLLGDYDTVVGTDKEKFLQECTASLSANGKVSVKGRVNLRVTIKASFRARFG